MIISNRDDCSVPAGSTLFSDDPAQGPLTHYRCNHAGHLCHDPNGNQVAPPIDPPADAVIRRWCRRRSRWTNCESSETSGELTPISKIVADIKSLKPDPDNQILVSAIVGPPSPYAVQWAANASSGGAAWPAVAASCGTENADGSGAFGEPGVRIAQFASSFQNSVFGLDLRHELRRGLSPSPPGLASLWCPLPAGRHPDWTDSAGNTYPDCVVTEHLTTAGVRQDIAIPACAAAPAGTACWSLASRSVRVVDRRSSSRTSRSGRIRPTTRRPWDLLPGAVAALTRAPRQVACYALRRLNAANRPAMAA